MEALGIGGGMLAVGVLLAFFVSRRRIDGRAALLLTLLPPAGLALGIAFC